MSDRRAALRYAEALLAAAQERGEVDDLRGELDALVQAVEEAPLLRALLARPDLEPAQKEQALHAALGGRLSPLAFSLLGVLLAHGRGQDLGAVREAYRDLADEAAGIAQAEARSVVPLTPDQRRRLVAGLEKQFGRTIVLQERIDPSVLAGVSVQVGDRLIDGSAAGRLARMRDALLGPEG